MKTISIITPCYNEEGNIPIVHHEIKRLFNQYSHYLYEHIFIDNSSTDKTIEILRNIAHNDKHVKVIVNSRNFGHIRSPYYALLQATGDAVIMFASNLKDPPELIEDFLKKWEEGFEIVIGVKTKSKENPLMFMIRKLYYHLIHKFSDIEQIKNFIGFGLYDKKFCNVLRALQDPYPYFRGMVSEFGFKRCEIEYTQLKRERGKSKNNFYTLYDMAMLGFVNHSKIPLRMASFLGFGIALFSLLIAIGYFIYKIIFWDNFTVGMAPVVIGLFFFSAVQLFFIGIIGEYIGAIYTQVKNRPLVIERERINFDENTPTV